MIRNGTMERGQSYCMHGQSADRTKEVKEGGERGKK